MKGIPHEKSVESCLAKLLVVPVDAEQVRPRAEQAQNVGHAAGFDTEVLVGDPTFEGLEHAEVLHGPEVFREAALAAARQFRFRPGRHEGERRKVWMRMPITFKLN